MKYRGQETTITGDDGKAYTLSRLTVKIQGQFAEWAASRLPDPLAEAARSIKDYPAHLQEIIVKEALQEARAGRDFGSPAVQKLLERSGEAQAKFFQLMLQEHHPGITEEEAYEVAKHVKSEDSFRPGGESV